jgi:hypothetical protein
MANVSANYVVVIIGIGLLSVETVQVTAFTASLIPPTGAASSSCLQDIRAVSFSTRKPRAWPPKKWTV